MERAEEEALVGRGRMLTVLLPGTAAPRQTRGQVQAAVQSAPTSAAAPGRSQHCRRGEPATSLTNPGFRDG